MTFPLKSVINFIKNSFVNLTLVFISLLFCFILLELGFRFAGYQAIYDTYSKSSLLWQYDPLLGWSHKPNSYAVYTGPRPWPVEYSTPIHINSVGLRGPEVGDKNSLRILVLGDSITAGFEVAYEETYASQLQKILSKHFNKPVQVINAGVRGYGTDQSYLYYKERGKNLQADIVLFLHVSNDPLNNITLHRMRRPFGKPAFQIVSENNQEQLNLIGYPTPDYTLCSEYRLDKNYQIEKIDTSINRTLCWVQMRFTDYSAFFTYIAFKIRQHPELLKKLYYAGNPEKNPKKDAENNSIKTTKDSPHEATSVKSTSVKSADALNVAQQPKQEQQIIDAIVNKPAIPGNSATPDKLTTFIIKQLAQAVKSHKAHFTLLTLNNHSQFQVDKQALQNEGIHIINIDLSAKEGDPEHLYDFKNDAHWNKTGHKAFAERLVPKLLKKYHDSK